MTMSSPLPVVIVSLPPTDRKSTRLNSSHEWISYAVFCLKKKKQENERILEPRRHIHVRHGLEDCRRHDTEQPTDEAADTAERGDGRGQHGSLQHEFRVGS